MTTLRFLSAGLVAASMLTTPALAQEFRPGPRYVTPGPDLSFRPMGGYGYGYGYTYGQSCSPAPRVGAFATQPWDNSVPCEPYGYSGYSPY